MVRLALLGAALALLVVTGGCVGTQVGGTSTPTQTPTQTPSRTVTTHGPSTTTATPTPTGAGSPTHSRGTDCPVFLHVDPAQDDQRPDDVLAYDSLPPERRAEFDRARENGTTTLGDGLPETWGQARFVEYRGTTYGVVASTC